MEQTKKKWYKSKSLWFNAISLTLLLAVSLNDVSVFGKTTVVVAGVIVTFGNGILRLMTSDAISHPLN